MKNRLVATIKNQRIFVKEYSGKNYFFTYPADNDNATHSLVESFAQAVVLICDDLKLINYEKVTE